MESCWREVLPLCVMQASRKKRGVFRGCAAPLCNSYSPSLSIRMLS